VSHSRSPAPTLAVLTGPPPPRLTELPAGPGPGRGGHPGAADLRVLGFSPQAYYAWLAAPISARDLEDAYLINVLVDAHSGWRQLRIVTVAAPTGRGDTR
jgi:hypothetical protein